MIEGLSNIWREIRGKSYYKKCKKRINNNKAVWKIIDRSEIGVVRRE